MSNDKSLEVYVVISQKKLSCKIFDKKNDQKRNERKSWELTVHCSVINDVKNFTNSEFFCFIFFDAKNPFTIIDEICQPKISKFWIWFLEFGIEPCEQLIDEHFNYRIRDLNLCLLSYKYVHTLVHTTHLHGCVLVFYK